MLGVIIGVLLGLICGSVLVYYVLAVRLKDVKVQKRKQDAWERKLREGDQKVRQEFEQLRNAYADLAAKEGEFRSRHVTYEELKNENGVLKRDLQNVDVERRKLLLDHANQRRRQDQLDERAESLGRTYLKDHVSWIGKKLSANNYANSKKQLLKVINSCRDMGCDVPEEEEKELLADLKSEYEKAVRAELEREEQARIKAQIREEQRLQREIDKELEQVARERAAIQAALEQALAEADDEHAAEIESLRAKLKEAEERSERAMSRAQMTKSGHVYVISNIGSFGEDIYKIGMTRRLEPNDRVRELSSASVPFPFDVHMMISCDDAPTLENALHRSLRTKRINKANPRKEFFRASLDDICVLVKEHHGVVDYIYIADAEALEYRQTMEMSEEDLELVEAAYSSGDDDDDDEVIEDF